MGKVKEHIMSERKVTGYMCEIDWRHELGEASGGNKVYGSLNDLKHHHTCWEECGVVEVEVRKVKVVSESTLYGKGSNDGN